MTRFRQLLKRWTDVSIWVKSILLVGLMLISLWALVILATQQLRGFSTASDVIMNEYMDITSFMDAFSAENVALEAYIRPSISETALEDYIDARSRTDRYLHDLTPDARADAHDEFMLKQAIGNAMTYYRQSQNELLAMDSAQAKMQQYLSMKTQSAYIDGYTRDLLHTRMGQGGEQWRRISAANEKRTRQLITFLVLITLLVCVALTIFVRSVLRPVAELGRAADRISVGQYDAPPLAICGGDELGRTARSFNLMQQEIRSTIHALEKQSEMEKNLRKKEVEAAQMQHALQEGRFAHLQSQINPHFLFNTLSTIAALSREEGAPLSEDLIIRLSNFFRYSLESDEKMVPLGREIELLQDYIELQETRYSGRIHTEIVMEPGLERVIVPKFILQPLVENSMLHGLKDTAGGEIRVHGRRVGADTVITVTDNGCGFDTRKTGENDGRRRSVGMKNIAERMELNGGELRVFSRVGWGTCAKIIVRGAKQS